MLLLIFTLASATERGDRLNYAGQIKTQVSRQVFLLNADWDYLEDDQIKFIDLDDARNWASINLPHTWNAFDATDNEPGYRRSASWYRKSIMLPKYKGKRTVRLNFEGVNLYCEVYVNGKLAGTHTGGYIGFVVDITDFLKKGRQNEIIVLADNSINHDIIPSQISDFFIYGVIVRDVWLEVLPAVYNNGLKISTPQVSRAHAETVVQLDVANSTGKLVEATIDVAIIDPSGNMAKQVQVVQTIKPGGSLIDIELPGVNNPALWSPSVPNLYTLSVDVSAGKVVDRTTERFGYRWFEFEEHGPFYLNGERLLLRGTHRHEEWAGYGNALPDSLHRKDMELIKAMGANFVRLAHYPQDPEIYRACDELGLLVWDELPWCRGGVGGPVWKANSMRLFEEQITQNYNHPSIIMWSVGNEMYWLPLVEHGGDIDSMNAFVNVLNDLAHDMDSGRPTTMRKYYDGADITDVFSPSIWAGWYSGVYKTYEQAISQARKKYPRLIHVEYGGASHVGRHNESPITGEGMLREDEWDEKQNMINIKKISSDGDWSENYIVDLFDWHLMVTEQLDWFTGNAQWAFKDFGTPLRPENAIPYINQKGLVDRAGNPKDAYYVFKSYWTTSPKFAYIESHTWTDRSGLPGEARDISVYSNCDQVQLVFNGNPLMKKQRDIKQWPASGFNWSVQFEAGINQIVAVGYADGLKISRDSLTVNYNYRKNGTPSMIILTEEPLTNGNILVVATVVDKVGQRCLDFDKRVYFDHDGAGQLLTGYGTPTRSDVIEFASGRAAIEVVPAQGKAIIEARTQDFKGSYLVIETK